MNKLESILIKSFDSFIPSLVVRVTQSCKVGELKKKIQIKLGGNICPFDMRLLFNGKMLKNHDTVGSTDTLYLDIVA